LSFHYAARLADEVKSADGWNRPSRPWKMAALLDTAGPGDPRRVGKLKGTSNPPESGQFMVPAFDSPQDRAMILPG
jgi:hypothetical protein